MPGESYPSEGNQTGGQVERVTQLARPKTELYIEIVVQATVAW